MIRPGKIRLGRVLKDDSSHYKDGLPQKPFSDSFLSDKQTPLSIQILKPHLRAKPALISKKLS
jgi:hypothetical protein